MPLKLWIYFGATLASLIAYGYEFPSDNLLNHFPYIEVLQNNNLYPHDFYVQEFRRFSPRYYYQFFIVGLTELGLPLSWIYFGVYTLSYSGFILGLFALARKFNASLIGAATLAFLCLSASVGTIGYVDLFRTEPIPAIWSMGLVIWGIVCCYSNRWISGYLLFGLASLPQLLVGVLPGVLMTPLLVKYAYTHRSFKPLILSLLGLGLFAASVYLPMKLTGATGGTTLSHQEFVHIYGSIRHPHHIILSSLDYSIWRNFLFFLIGGILNILALKSLNFNQKQDLLIPILFGAFILPFGYLFVEIYPITLVAKLQLARVTPFMQLFCLIGFSLLAQDFYQKRNFGSALLVVTILVVQPTLAIAPILGILIITNRWQRWNNKLQSLIALAIVVILCLLEVRDDPSQAIRHLAWLAILWGCFLIPAAVEAIESNHRWCPSWFLQRPTVIKGFIASISAIPLIILGLGLQSWLPRFVQNPFNGRMSLDSYYRKIPLYHLGVRVRDKTPEDALILIPGSYYNFRAYSQRSVVFAFKSMPFTDEGIQEWFKRLNKMQEMASSYKEHTPQQLTQLAHEFGASYVLTHEDWHPNIPYPILDHEDNWVIYQVPSSGLANHDQEENP